MPDRAVVIAIDGPAASGKGTLARGIAAALGLRHLDSGLIYRAAARRLLAAGGRTDDAAAAIAAARAVTEADLADPRLRDPDVAQAASAVAAIQGVRDVLLERQRAFAAKPPGAVIDGRDIGTVVCPDADVKLFVIADTAERARRRHAELTAMGIAVGLEEVRHELESRDLRDKGRDIAPLRQAPDAVVFDTTDLGPTEMLAAALDTIRRKLGPRVPQGTSCDSTATRL